MSFIIRPGTEADIKACANLDRSFPNDRVLFVNVAVAAPEHTVSLRLKQVKPAGGRRTHQVDEEHIRGRDEGLDGAEMFWVGELDGHAIGYLILRTWDWQRLVGQISQIAVDRPHHGIGIGTALVETAKAYAVERGLRVLMWETQTDNVEAIEFALRRGFVLAGYNALYYENDGLARQVAPDFMGIAIFLCWPNSANE